MQGWGCGTLIRVDSRLSRSGLERPVTEGNNPVGEKTNPTERIPSTTGHEESRGNQGGPPPKAKYFVRPIVNKYREGKVKSTPGGE
jgi:hypothetical protein